MTAGTGAAIVDDRRAVTYDELDADVFGLRACVPADAPVVLRATRAVTVAAAMVALERRAAEVHLAGRLPVEAPAGAVELDDDLTGRDPGRIAAPTNGFAGPGAPAAAPRATRWRLFTSGTTGTPKPIDHTLASLSRTVRRRAGVEPLRWGLLYEPTRMAGVQVLLQALGERAPLFDATHLPRLADRVAWFAEQGVEGLSATPTAWRQLLQVPASSDLPLRQITLGGEIADQPLLDKLRDRFPTARITHVFASTETGAAFSVSDGREGFPRSYLTDPPAGIQLQLRDSQLHVHAPLSSAAEADGFAPTGDVVELVGDRVVFRGRNTGAVNVGGVKVWPEEVEAVLRAHPEVDDALVTSKRNPFSGFILRAQVVARESAGADVATLPARLRAHCAATLTGAHVPAVVKVVADLPTSAAGKALRREVDA